MAKEDGKSLTDRTNAVITDPELMNRIFIHVASGGSLIEMCRAWEVRYADIMLHINSDKDRMSYYNDALNARNEWFKEAVLLEFRLIGMSDIRKLYDEDGKLLPVSEWPEEVAKFVSSIEQVEEFEGKGRDKEQIGWVKKVKLWNKEKALEMIGKNLSMFTEVHNHTGRITLEDIVQGSRDIDEQ